MLITLEDLAGRLEGAGREWHPALIQAFERYSSARARYAARGKDTRPDPGPYWLLVPQWLHGRFSGGAGGDRKFLLDVLAGQFCAFLALKIHDDVFDGHVQDRSLIFAADYLLLSARDSYAPHVRRNPRFWRFFDSSIRRTLCAITEWDESQVHGYAAHDEVFAMIRRGYSVCNIGTYALCERMKRPGLFRTVERCTDELAFVGHLLDDLEDIEDDLGRGRVNYAAWFMTGGIPRKRNNVIPELARGIVQNGSAERYYGMLRGHLERAGKIAATVDIPGLSDYVTSYRKAVERSERAAHRKRVRMVFAAAGI